jgi:hypothetical protein
MTYRQTYHGADPFMMWKKEEKRMKKEEGRVHLIGWPLRRGLGR